MLSRIAWLFGVDISVLTNAANAAQVSPEVIVVDDETILLAGEMTTETTGTTESYDTSELLINAIR